MNESSWPCRFIHSFACNNAPRYNTTPAGSIPDDDDCSMIKVCVERVWPAFSFKTASPSSPTSNDESIHGCLREHVSPIFEIVAGTETATESAFFVRTRQAIITMTRATSSKSDTAVVVAPPPRVQWSQQQGDPPERATRSSSRPPPQPHPAKIVVGKANVVRDLSIFAVVLTVALYFSLSFSSPGGGQDRSKNIVGGKKKNNQAKPPVVEKKESLFASTIKTILETRHRAKTCEFYLHNGRIPRAGLSLFAGREYAMGDILFTNLPSLPLVVVPPGAATTAADGGDGSSSSFSYVPLLAHLVKPHPTLANVKFVPTHRDDNTGGGSFHFALQVTKSIPAGTELFQSMDDDDNELLQQYFDQLYSRTVPTQQEYQMAYDIAMELPYENPPNFKWDNRHSAQQKRPSFQTIQKHVRSAILKVNAKIGHLLSQAPGGDPALLPVSEILLRRPQWNQMIRAGSCVEKDHVNSYKVGEVVAQIPLHSVGRRKRGAAVAAVCPTIAYGASSSPQYCGIVSSIPITVAASGAEEILPNVKLQWKADTDDHRPILLAIATREIPPHAKVSFYLSSSNGNRFHSLPCAFSFSHFCSLTSSSS
jgi:hypothetical protein